MVSRLVLAAALSVVALPAFAGQAAPPTPLPTRDGRPIVASVNGDPIALDEMVLHGGTDVDVARLREGRASSAEFSLLERLITIRLVVGEAATMGFGDIPEIRKQVDVTSRQVLRDVLMERIAKEVKPDEAAIATLSAQLSREWKTASLLFADESAAKAVHAELTAGGDFDAVAARAVAAKQAQSEGGGDFHPRKDYLPEIAQAIADMQQGQISPVIKIPAGFVVVRVSEVRQSPDEETKRQAAEEARSATLSRQQQEAIKHYEDSLRERVAVIKQDVLDSIDFAAPTPGFDGLLKDTRVVAEIKGAPSVTVGDLADYLRMQFYHGGSNTAGQGARYNSRKVIALDATVMRRALNAEAIRLGVDTSPDYTDRINAFEESLVFDTFVSRVIVPDSKVREEDVKAYYEEHKAEHSYPGMLKVRALAFTKRAGAESAVEKLRTGTDFGWLADHASDQAPKDAPGLLTFDGRPLTADGMPEGVRKVLADAKQGDVRLHASPEGLFYALSVQEVVAPAPKPYDEVRSQIATDLYGEKLRKNVEAYAAKLRALSKVEIFVTRMD